MLCPVCSNLKKWNTPYRTPTSVLAVITVIFFPVVSIVLITKPSGLKPDVTLMISAPGIAGSFEISPIKSELLA